jgi:hypothetical protein
MSANNLTEEDEGKRVTSADGEQVGMVEEVRGGTAYINPDAGMVDKMKAKLDWGDTDEESYPIQSDHVSDVTDDEIRLR